MAENDTTTVVITRRDRSRLGNVDITKSLTENFTTIMDVYERTLLSPAQIDEANPSECGDAEWIIERALEVLHDKVVSCDTCIYPCDWNVAPCDGCLDFSEWDNGALR